MLTVPSLLSSMTGWSMWPLGIFTSARISYKQFSLNSQSCHILERVIEIPGKKQTQGQKAQMCKNKTMIVKHNFGSWYVQKSN